jgi:SAM-dependent methyltransferase
MGSEAKIIDYYTSTLRDGDSRHSLVGWGSEKGMWDRIKILTDIARRAGAETLLDVGCGTGELAHFWQPDAYTGIDIVPEMVLKARDSNGWKALPAMFDCRDIVKQPFERGFDAVVASGIFNLDVGVQETPEEGLKTIETMWSHTKIVCVFNMLSARTKERQLGDFYWPAARMLGFCLTITPFVTLRHDYRQNDFTIAMYREQQPA